MLRKEGHNQTVGYYLLGVLLYEMLVGKLPFYDFDVAIMLSKIVRTPVKVPSSVSTQATQLLTRLLDKDPSTRLGAGGTNEIKAHPFFQEIDWEAAYQRKLRPPPITHTRRVKTEGLSLEKVYGLALEGDYEGKVPGWSFVQGRPHS
jgi:serine/threonine protein kinase